MLGRRGTGVLNMTGSPTCAPAQRFGIDSDFGLDYLPKSNTSTAEWSERWGFPVTMTRPLSAHDCIRQIQKGDIEGSIFLGPTSPPTGANGTGPLCRVHLSTHLDSAMLAPAQHTLLLPMGIGAESSMYSTPFRIIHFHKPTAPYGGLRPAWRTLGDLAAKMRPHLSGHLKFQMYTPFGPKCRHPLMPTTGCAAIGSTIGCSGPPF